jgi:hypothetical protein
MNYGAFSMIQKQDAKACNGKHQGHLGAPCPSKHNVDFFDHKDTVQFEFPEQGQIVNQHCYLEILARLHEADCWRRRKLTSMLRSFIMSMPLPTTHLLARSLAKKLILTVNIFKYSDLWIYITEKRPDIKRHSTTKILFMILKNFPNFAHELEKSFSYIPSFTALSLDLSLASMCSSVSQVS